MGSYHTCKFHVIGIDQTFQIVGSTNDGRGVSECDMTECAGASIPGLLNDLRQIRVLGRVMADRGQALNAQLATLDQHREKLRGLCLDANPQVPPLALLLDNMRNLVLRRAWRDGPRELLMVQFYGADAGALVGGSYQLPRGAEEAWYATIHPADRAAYRAREARRERRREGYTAEYRYLHAASGRFHWARETAATPYQAASGRWILDSCILDVTEQKQTEEALRASEARYRAIVEDQSEYIRRLDADLRLTFVNGALRRLLQRPPQQLLGADLLRLMPAAEADEVRRRLALLTPEQPTVSYEIEVARPDGSCGWHEWTDRAIFDQGGEIREYQSVGRDVTERKLAEQRARYLLQHDPLTGLPNRALLEEHLRQALKQARRDRRRTAVLLLDMDGFKQVNDSHGHLVGDRLLRAVGQRLRQGVRASDVVARLGGDEFAIVLTAVDCPDGAEALARKLVGVVARPFANRGRPLQLAASGGVALFPDHAETPLELMHAADVALYRAKADGRNTARLFAPPMAAMISARRALEQDLRAALERGELELFYQPRIDLQSRRIVAVEALARWRRPGYGLLAPQAFLEVAEEAGLAHALDRWAIERACRQAVAWRQAGLAPRIAVNLAAGEASDPGLAGGVRQILERTGLAPSCLELELSEHAVIDAGSEATIACLNRVAELGVGLAIDDFGSGFSSFACLRRLPAQTIKIDGSFIAQIGRNEDEAIIKAIIDLSHSLGKRVVAEGVETKGQLAFLEAQGCDEAQGFLFCPPLPAGEARDWLAAAVVVARSPEGALPSELAAE